MKVEGQDFLQNRSCFFGSFVLPGVLLFDFILVLRCYTVKKCQLEKAQKHFHLSRGTLHCFSALFITDSGIAKSLSQTTTQETPWPNMEILPQTVSFDSISATYPLFHTQMYKNGTGSMLSSYSRYTCFSCDLMSTALTASPARSVVKSTDLYSPTFPSHSYRRL